MVNYSLESLGQSFRSGNRPTEMELELEMASIREGMAELGAESDMLDRAFDSAELAMDIIENFKDEDQCLELLKCQATMESLINVNGGTINDLTVSTAQEGIKEFFKTIWEKIKTFFAKLWDYIKRFFTWLGEKLGICSDKIKSAESKLKTTDKKKLNEKLKSKRPNAKSKSSTESISVGLEDYSDWKWMPTYFYSAENVSKITASLMKAMDSDTLDDLDLPFDDAEKIVDGGLRNFEDNGPYRDINLKFERFFDRVSANGDGPHSTISVDDVQVYVGTSKIEIMAIKPQPENATYYDLGYKSDAQIKMLIDRLKTFTKSVEDANRARYRRLAYLDHWSKRVSEMSTQDVDEKYKQQYSRMLTLTRNMLKASRILVGANVALTRNTEEFIRYTAMRLECILD